MHITYEDGWQNVKDHLPPIGQPVIVARAGQQRTFEATRLKFGRTWQWTNATWSYQPIPDKSNKSGITHWRPFPEGPKLEEG